MDLKLLGLAVLLSASASAQGCLKEDNIDYVGKTIHDGIQNSMEDCAKWCGKEPKCKFWTYRKSDNRCWLKFSDSGRREIANVMSGTKNCAITVDLEASVVALQDTVATLTAKLGFLIIKVDENTKNIDKKEDRTTYKPDDIYVYKDGTVAQSSNSNPKEGLYL